MKFLIQKTNGKVTHDFSLALLEAIRYQKWLQNGNDIKYKFLDSKWDGKVYAPIGFKSFHKNYVPVGSVEFVCAYLDVFYDIVPQQINVPEELFGFAGRVIFNDSEKNFEKNLNSYGKWFAKSNNKIKYFAKVVDENTVLEAGNYQFSELIDIDSEWRCFVYNNKLVGLQNYSGDFTKFPNVNTINIMIYSYTPNAPIAYTLDVLINSMGTYVMECHSMFSTGLYGFADYNILPQMLHRAFKELIR